MSSSVKPESASEGPIVLRIYGPRVDDAHSWTGIPLPSKDTPLQRVLELACQKRKAPHPYDHYALLLVLSTAPPGSHAGNISATIIAPLNKAVSTLPQVLEGLVLVPRNRLDLLAPHRNLYLPAYYGADSEPTCGFNDVADYAAIYKGYGMEERQRAKGLKRFVSNAMGERRALIINGDQLEIRPLTERMAVTRPEFYNLRNIVMTRSPDNTSAFTIEVLQNGSGTLRDACSDSSRRVRHFDAVDPRKVDELLQTVEMLQMLWVPGIKQSNREFSGIQRCSSVSTTSTLVGNLEKDEYLAD